MVGQFGDDKVDRIPVGTHYRVWWFWLPLILSGLCLLIAAVLWPVARPLGMIAGCVGMGFVVWAIGSVVIIERGRRWIEHDDARIRVISRTETVEFTDEDVTDLAISRILHHAAGRLVAYSRDLRLWVETPRGRWKLRLVNRIVPHSSDPLQDLIERLRFGLMQRAVDRLARGDSVSGDGWELDGKAFRVTSAKLEASLPIASIAAVETVGQEVRIWRTGVPRAVIRLPLSGRNTWMIERLLSALPDRRSAEGTTEKPPAPSNPLGRILFERTTGAAVSVLFAVLGVVIAAASVIVIIMAVRAGEPVGVIVGVLLGFVGGLCLVGGLRVRRVRFCCYEHGLERVTMTGRKVLGFSEIDVFSFEARRNHSHGRYTGTTYTLVFADRSREQGRGIFFSSTVHNTDEELEMLRDRVSEQLARRMAATFARNKRVQWTPELWFHDEVLELSRPRRLLSGPKLTVVPYDAVTDFEVREGVFHLWTNYQERAVISVKTSSANFYPGVIVLEGLVNAHVREPANEWSPSAAVR